METELSRLGRCPPSCSSAGAYGLGPRPQDRGSLRRPPTRPPVTLALGGQPWGRRGGALGFRVMKCKWQRSHASVASGRGAEIPSASHSPYLGFLQASFGRMCRQIASSATTTARYLHLSHLHCDNVIFFSGCLFLRWNYL